MDLEGQYGERGYAMAALLVGLAVMSVLMSAALPVWRHDMQREKEAELVFRGEQYARAVALFRAKNANAFPPSVDVLVQGKYLRKKYLDPITGKEFDIIGAAVQTAPGQAQAGAGAGRGRAGSSQLQTGSSQPPLGRNGSFSGQPPAGGGSSGLSQPPLGGGSALATQPPAGGSGVSPTQPPTGGSGAPSTPPPFGSGSIGTAQSPGGGSTAVVGGGMMGVHSKSQENSIRIYKGQTRYDQWNFVFTVTNRPGGAAPGALNPGTQGGSATPGSRGGRGASPFPGSSGRGGQGSGGLGSSPSAPPTIPPGRGGVPQ